MSILVTGGAGFIAFNVVESLLGSGREVVLLDRNPLPAVMQSAVEQYSKSLTIEQADILDKAALSGIFARHRIEGVIHCAVITSGPQREARDPENVVDVNLKGSINVLSAVRDAKNKVKRLVYSSSAAAYGETRYRMPVSETSAAVPDTLYAITKFAAERMCLRLGELWGVDVVCARLGSSMGPWERTTGARDFLGTHTQLALCAATGKHAILPRETTSVDWIYSRDTAAGLIALLDAPAVGDTMYNLSSGWDWTGSLISWCSQLKTIYDNFDYRIADGGHAPTISNIDARNRYPMEVTRIKRALSFKPRQPEAARADFLEWIARTPDFWKLNVASTGRAE